MGTSINLTLTWTASSNATEYQYCTSTTSSDTCSKSWKSVGTALSVSLTNLKFSKTYYWQVRAVNSKGKTYANSGSWWSFTTKESPPGSFKKHDPEKGATSVSTHPSLNWGSSSNAVYYQYCYDTNNDDTCNGTWKKTAGKEVKLSSLNKNTTYYWQVRAVNENATTYANSGAWWSFTIKK
jgi:hypothetical protein